MAPFAEEFVSCLDLSGRCEAPHVLGAVGTCNATSGLCLCPEGFFGEDDFENFNDCHIDQRAQRRMYAVCIGLGAVLCVQSLAALAYLLRHWGFLDDLFGWDDPRRRPSLRSEPDRDRVVVSAPIGKRTEASSMTGLSAGEYKPARAASAPTTATATAGSSSVNINNNNNNNNNSAINGASSFGSPDRLAGHRSANAPVSAEVQAQRAERLAKRRERRQRWSMFSTARRISGVFTPAPQPALSVTGLGYHYNFAQPLTVTPTDDLDVGSDDDSEENLTQRWAKRLKLLRRRQIETLVVLVLFFVYSIGLFLYYVPLFIGKRRFDQVLVLDIGAMMSSASMFSGFWLMSYIWYQALPPLQLYGRRVNVSSVLLRYPNLVRSVTIGNVAFVNIATLLLLVIIPNAREDLRHICNEIILVCYLIFIVAFTSYYTFLCNTLRRVLEELARLYNSRGPPVREGDLELPRAQPLQDTSRDTDAFKKGISVARIMTKVSAIIGGVAAVTALLAIVATPFHKRLYFSLGLIAACAAFVAILTTFILVFRLRGPRQRAAWHSKRNLSVLSRPSLLSTGSVRE